jgi:hypothetical protein
MSITWNVPLYAQADFNTCWRAALRMMVAWRQNRHIPDADWERRCKSLLSGPFGSARPVLADFQINQVARKLGIRGNQDNKLTQFVTHLAMGPVMFHLPGPSFGHMVVAISPLAARRKGFSVEPTGPTSFKIAYPCASGYPPGPCRAGTSVIPAGRVESAIARGFMWYWK